MELYNYIIHVHVLHEIFLLLFNYTPQHLVTMCSCERKTPNLYNNHTHIHILINCFQITWRERMRVYTNLLLALNVEHYLHALLQMQTKVVHSGYKLGLLCKQTNFLGQNLGDVHGFVHLLPSNLDQSGLCCFSYVRDKIIPPIKLSLLDELNNSQYIYYVYF